MKSRIYFLIILIICTARNTLKAQNTSPIIGIIAFPTDDKMTQATVDYKYVRWLEASGGSSIAIQPWKDDAYIDEILTKINGILIQGGNLEMDNKNTYVIMVEKVMDKVMKLADTTNTKIPIFGIDSGFQLLQFLIADEPILSIYPPINDSVPLVFNKIRLETTKLFSRFEDRDFFFLYLEGVTSHVHMMGVDPLVYERNSKLRNFFRITSTGIADYKYGKTFISTIEAFNYPIYGTQFHPENIAFEKDERIKASNSYESVEISRSIGNFFILDAKNSNKNFLAREDYVRYSYIDTYNQYPELKNGVYSYYYNK